jgi:hypothetical protein
MAKACAPQLTLLRGVIRTAAQARVDTAKRVSDKRFTTDGGLASGEDVQKFESRRCGGSTG